MKKAVILIVSIILFCSLLTACRGNQKLDCKTLLDTATGNTISLGETKKSIEKKYQMTGEEIGDDHYFYEEVKLFVVYEDGKATSISTSYDFGDRFATVVYKPGMKAKDMPKEFEDEVGDVLDFYKSYYDKKGNICDRADAAYSLRYSFSIARDEIYSITLGLY